MANRQTSLGKIEDSIECPICTNRFREPKWLDCFHTFCLQCLHEVCTSQRPRSNKLPCPLCRQETILTNGNVSDLPNNSEMKALVEAFTQQENILKQQFEQLEEFSKLVAKARRSKTEFELSVENLGKSLEELDKVFCRMKEKISKKAAAEFVRIKDEEQKLIKEVESIHINKVELLKSLQASDRSEASQTARKLDEVNHLLAQGSNGNKGQDFKKRIIKELEEATSKHPQSVPVGLTFMDFKENDVTSLGKIVQHQKDLTLLNQWTRQKYFRKPDILSKYTYREGQWSPVNPEGKRAYDRDFLLQFQGNYYKKPEGLPYVPGIVLDNPTDRLPKASMEHPQDSTQVYPVMTGSRKQNPGKAKSSSNSPQRTSPFSQIHADSSQNIFVPASQPYTFIDPADNVYGARFPGNFFNQPGPVESREEQPQTAWEVHGWRPRTWNWTSQREEPQPFGGVQ